ncbi:hypothetical protein GCM10007938_32020 [Vibrio zhanjiangensis]|uniref:Uncharacterized protein n=1 Tax=Vibrio zhanjiangensis TaxID=1046128 RepID=A0ABQ6F1U1_9VIBR|nr:hypothetical protein [Vibrio zhanjiangensis]GLT19420.1 hypothetical protein GCM10007938_32020 [Vibrio zhanjiangensis]
MRVFALAMLTIFSFSVQAQSSTCSKNFPYHFVTKDGTLGLYQGSGGAWWYACNISEKKYGVTPESCRAALSSYLTAKAQAKPVTFSVEGTCAPFNSTNSTFQGFNWFGVYW